MACAAPRARSRGRHRVCARGCAPTVARSFIEHVANDVPNDPALVASRAQAAPFAGHTAPRATGADMRELAIGAPSLADNVWLYGDGVFETERRSHGIRPKTAKSRSVTDMPAFDSGAERRRHPQRGPVRAEGRWTSLSSGPRTRAAGSLATRTAATVTRRMRAATLRRRSLTANVWNSGGERTISTKRFTSVSAARCRRGSRR